MSSNRLVESAHPPTIPPIDFQGHLGRTVNGALPRFNDPKTQIRLLRFRDDCFLQFEVHDTADAPPYQALSYAWNETQDRPKMAIKIQNNDDWHTWQIHWNLFSFFYHTSHLWIIGSHIWVDYLCIDQDSLTEKTDQVAQMSIIYSQASQVTIWLGDFDDQQGSATPDFSAPAPQSEFLSLDGQTFGPWKTRDEASRAITTRNYWSRIWIVQEIILAQDRPAICFGKYVLSWQDVCSCFTGNRPELSVYIDYFTNPPKGGLPDGVLSGKALLVGELIDARSMHIIEKANRLESNAEVENPYKSLPHLFQSLATQRFCTEPRDYIYALLGISNETLIQADYLMDLETLFHKAIGLPSVDDAVHFASLLRMKLGLQHISWLDLLDDTSFQSHVFRCQLVKLGTAGTTCKEPIVATYLDEPQTWEVCATVGGIEPDGVHFNCIAPLSMHDNDVLYELLGTRIAIIDMHDRQSFQMGLLVPTGLETWKKPDCLRFLGDVANMFKGVSLPLAAGSSDFETILLPRNALIMALTCQWDYDLTNHLDVGKDFEGLSYTRRLLQKKDQSNERIRSYLHS